MCSSECDLGATCRFLCSRERKRGERTATRRLSGSRFKIGLEVREGVEWTSNETKFLAGVLSESRGGKDLRGEGNEWRRDATTPILDHQSVIELFLHELEGRETDAL